MIEFQRYDHVLLTFPEGKEEKVREFYQDCLGLEEVYGEHPGGALWFRVAGIELHFGAEESGIPSRRHVAFEIKELEEAKRYLKGRGVEVAYSTPIEGRERFFIRDPFGNRLEFLEYHRPTVDE